MVASALKKTMLLSAMLFATVGALAFGITAACAGDSQVMTKAPPRVTEVADVNGTIDLVRSEAAPGEQIVVTGRGWTGFGTVRFYLLTEQQFGEGSVRSYNQQAVQLGEATPDRDGSVVLRFRLANTYRSPDGQSLAITPGLKLYVHAQQDTQRGSYGEGVGPLVVQPSRR